MDPRLTWVWLAQACTAGSRAALNLLYHFGTPEKIWKAERRELASVLQSSELSLLTRLAHKDTSEAAEIIRRCDASGIRILTPMDAQYPRSLYQLRDAPCVLYVRGVLPDFEQNCCCAVVGTRKMSDYGKQMAYDIGRGLGAGGAVLVSGLALGVDGMSMAGALSAGGVTIGILG
ncbi:MAG: DNA-protecting protein DprA, partial [Clostridia bacterium]|nr:DNA-protecting protein DprA [Clostridia bacterium]